MAESDRQRYPRTTGSIQGGRLSTRNLKGTRIQLSGYAHLLAKRFYLSCGGGFVLGGLIFHPDFLVFRELGRATRRIPQPGWVLRKKSPGVTTALRTLYPPENRETQQIEREEYSNSEGGPSLSNCGRPSFLARTWRPLRYRHQAPLEAEGIAKSSGRAGSQAGRRAGSLCSTFRPLLPIQPTQRRSFPTTGKRRQFLELLIPIPGFFANYQTEGVGGYLSRWRRW